MKLKNNPKIIEWGFGSNGGNNAIKRKHPTNITGTRIKVKENRNR